MDRIRARKEEGRLEAFLSGPDGVVFTGPKRTGAHGLVERVRDFFAAAFPETEILTVGDDDSVTDALANHGGGAAVFILDVAHHPAWESEVEAAENSPSLVFYGRELCHQLPACVKRVPGNG